MILRFTPFKKNGAVTWKLDCFHAALKLVVAGSRKTNVKTAENSFKSKMLVIEMKHFKMSILLVYVKG